MELSFNKGNYDEYIDMVKASKELLNDSLLLRSIQDNVNSEINANKDVVDNSEHFILMLAICLILTLMVLIHFVIVGLSWHILPLLFAIGYVIYYKTKMNAPTFESSLHSKKVHDEEPKPLKYLEMKVVYLCQLAAYKKNSIQLVMVFYMILFPFIAFFLFELLFQRPPFGNLFLGLIAAAIICSPIWYFIMRRDLAKANFDFNQFNDYLTLINQQSNLAIG
jgi:hypothetical protein